MDKENVVCGHNEILFRHKKKEILSFMTKQMDFEGIMLNEISQKKTIPYNLTYMWNLKQKGKLIHSIGLCFIDIDLSINIYLLVAWRIQDSIHSEINFQRLNVE